jgi:3-deoxy-D-manno-octulosonic acid kinase
VSVAPPAGFVRLRAGERIAVALARHEADARAMLANGTLYDSAARLAGARPLQGRGVAYAVALPESGARAVVRHNRHGGLLAPLTGDLFLPPTRAPRELETARRLTELGVATPEVLMYGVSPALAVFRRADVVTGEIAGGRDLSELIAGDASDAERHDAWVATRALLRTMLAAGVRHHDLNVKNVLIAPAPEGVRAYLLDVDRVTFAAPGADAVRVGNLERLRRSARKWRDQRGARVDERELAELAAA